jgi:hypothetical protein
VEQLPDVVDAVAVIGVIVRPDDGIHLVDLRGQQLFAKVRSGVDQYARAGEFDGDRDTQPPVSRLLRSHAPHSLPIRGTPDDVPHPAREPSTRRLRKQAVEVVRRCPREVGDALPAQRGEARGRVRDERGLTRAPPGAEREREGSVGLDQQTVAGHRQRDRLQIAGVAERHDPENEM